MSTVQNLQAAVKRLGEAHVARAKLRRFLTGVTSLSLQEFGSLNAAGRRIGLNRFTGENRIRRAVTDNKLADQLQHLLVAEMFQNRSGYLYGSFPVRPVLHCHTCSICPQRQSHTRVVPSEPQ